MVNRNYKFEKRQKDMAKKKKKDDKQRKKIAKKQSDQDGTDTAPDTEDDQDGQQA